ncbi:MAG: AAA family ATPase [Clostridia bacterium]|nr:AAA family ATPase [Clostridia bacterium]
MLIRFSFKNFKSFKDENCLDMEATSLKEHEYNIARTENIDLLKVVAIYGANASGKTNVLQAFDYMKKRILVSDDSKKNSSIDEENIYSFMVNNEPISLEAQILAKNNKIYKYGFEVLKNSIVSEWLYIKKVNKFYSIFEREKNNITMKSNNKIFGLANIDERTLFLNIYSKIDKDNEDFNNVYEWFVNANYLDLGNPRFEDFINNRISLKILSNEKYKRELLRFIKTFDSGIEGIKTTPYSIEEVQNNNRVVKVELIHRGEDNKLKALPLDLESNGTRKMFHLFDFFMDALKNGMVLFIDELDAKLHPLLTRYIINLFHNSETNIGNGQLIYSTHDTVNLNKDTFRRDEIWFTEKNRDGVSEIYALSDYILEDDEDSKNKTGKKVRNDATYNKDYLTGRYGAIPVLEEFEINYEK